MTSNDDRLVADYLNQLASAAAGLPPDRRDELIEEISAHIAEARALQPDARTADEDVAHILRRLGRPQDIVSAAAEQAGADQEISAMSGYGVRSGYAGLAAGGLAGSRLAENGVTDSRYRPLGLSPSGFAAGGSRDSGLADSDEADSGIAGGALWTDSSTRWPTADGPPTLATPSSQQDPRRARMGALEICAVVLLLAGGFIIGIGWIAGVVLLWISPKWRVSDKLLGTLIWPGGLLGALLVVSGAGLLGHSAGSSCHTAAGTLNCAAAAGPGWFSVTVGLLLTAAALAGPILVSIRLVRQARREPLTNTAAV